MAKQAPVKATDELKEGFDLLSKDDKAWVKSLEKLGWRFSYDRGFGWAADKEGLEDPDAFHSFDSFMVMMNTVEAEERKISGLEIAEENAKGDRYLEGMGDVVVPELVALAKRRIAIVAEHKRLTQELIEVNEDCQNAAEKHKQHFTEDPVSHSLLYKGGGIELEIEHTEKTKVKTRLEDGAEDE